MAEATEDPLIPLMAEHADLRRLLTELRAAADADPSRVADVLPRLRTALRHHALREEEVLYDLCAPRLDGEEGAIGVLRADHHAILRHADALSGSPEAHGTAELRERVDRLARSLLDHLSQEERVLFPFVRALLSEAERGRLAHRLTPGAD